MMLERANSHRRLLNNLKHKRQNNLSKSRSSDHKEVDTDYAQKKRHLKFLTDVTNDIIDRGIYSERGLRSALNSQVKKKEYEMTNLDMENLMRQLKLELGVDTNKHKLQVLTSSSDINLSEMLSKHQSENNCIKALYPPAPPNRKTLQEIKELSQKNKICQDFPDLHNDEIKEILKEASLGKLLVNCYCTEF